MEAIINRVLKQQNLWLLEQVSERHGKDLDDLKRKYWTPSFYTIDVTGKHLKARVDTIEKKATRVDDGGGGNGGRCQGRPQS